MHNLTLASGDVVSTICTHDLQVATEKNLTVAHPYLTNDVHSISKTYCYGDALLQFKWKKLTYLKNSYYNSQDYIKQP